jgi:pimeloyl-ACP methyl ester carboxylesterase
LKLNNLNIQRYGRGEIKLVAIHGLGSAATAWDLVRPSLSDKYEFITLDLPGHGNAFMLANREMNPVRISQIIVHELHQIGIDKFHLIGNSLGGWIALEMAAAYPEKVLSVTGVAPAGLWLTPKTNRDGELAVSRILARITLPFATSISKFKFMRAIGFKLVSPQWEKFTPETCAKAAIAMGGASGYYTVWDAFLGNRFDKKISTNIPVTIIFGDTDNTLPASNSQEKSLAPKHSKWVVLPQSGHAPMWDQVDAVIAETISTINSAINK